MPWVVLLVVDGPRPGRLSPDPPIRSGGDVKSGVRRLGGDAGRRWVADSVALEPCGARGSVFGWWRAAVLVPGPARSGGRVVGGRGGGQAAAWSARMRLSALM